MRRAALLILLASVSACTGDASTPGFSVRDSAGIRIAESTLPAWTPERAWRIGPDPVLRIGASDGADDQILFGVIAARRLPNQDVVVLVDRGTELRRYDSAGGFVWSAGTAGDGPEDFRMGASIDLRAGDSLGVLDTRLWRYSILGLNGRVGRVVTLTTQREGALRPLGTLLDGSVVVTTTPGNSAVEETGRYRRMDTFIRFDLSGAVDTLGVFRGQEGFAVFQGDGVLYLAQAPFYLGRFQAVRGSDILMDFTENFEALVLDGTGQLRQIYRRAHEPWPLTSEQIDVWRSGWLESVRQNPSANPGSTARRRAVADEMTFNATHSVVDWLEVDVEGNVWMRNAPPPTIEGSPISLDWSVFDRDGRWLGECRLPERFRPTEFGSDYVLGVTTDALGVEYLEIYPLIKP